MKLIEYFRNAIGQLVNLRPLVRFLALCLTVTVLSMNHYQINFLAETLGSFTSREATLIVRIQQLENDITELKRVGTVPPKETNQQALPKALGNEKGAEEKLLEQASNYNKDLLITVFFALLGTVSTIALAVFGINFFANIFSRQQDREILGNELEQILLPRLQKYHDQTSAIVNRRISWLEYKAAVISAERSLKGCYLKHPLALEERGQAIKILFSLCQNDPSENAEYQLNNELTLLNSMLKDFNQEIADKGFNDNVRAKKLRKNLAYRIAKKCY
jgi:hypothetical protein